MTVYVAEEFTPDEADILRRYFTNLDGPVFALVNLPEVVKGALFARYCRSRPRACGGCSSTSSSATSTSPATHTIDATVGLRRAEELYDRVFFEYGDDSVAQLGGVHLACEQASNLLTKVLEWGRLMSYLEQSTRYIAYDARLGGRYRYYRDPACSPSPLGTRYVGDMDRLFDTYAELVPTRHRARPRRRSPKDPDDSDFVYRQAIRAKALDAVRGILPAASLSNVGIYGTGQAFEALLLRMRAHPLPEARAYAELMLHELRKVIPSFLRRVDLARPGRAPGATTSPAPATATGDVAERLFAGTTTRPTAPVGDARRLRPRRRGQAAGRDAATRTPTCPSTSSLDRVARLSARRARWRWSGPTSASGRNRRHKPGRAFERIDYRFDVLADYGAFRDLQRHRLLTIEWQPLTPAPRLRPARRRSTPPAQADASTRRWSARRRCTTPRRADFPAPGALRRRHGLPGALRHAVQRPRGDAPARAAHHARRAIPPTGGSARRCTG